MATDRTFSAEVGKRIEELREQRQMTQAELARFLGVSQQTVFSMEIGERGVRIHRLPALVAIFGVSADALLGLGPLPIEKLARIGPADRRHVEALRELTAGDRRVIRRVTEALRR